jgi:hypothetical protein
LHICLLLLPCSSDFTRLPSQLDQGEVTTSVYLPIKGDIRDKRQVGDSDDTLAEWELSLKSSTAVLSEVTEPAYMVACITGCTLARSL